MSPGDHRNADVDAYEATDLPKRRPNTMNNHGLVLTEIGLKKFAFMTAPTQEESPEDAQKREELYKQSCAGLQMKFVKWIWNLSTFFSVAPSLSPVALDVAVVLEGVTCAELEVYEAHMVVRCAIAEVGSDGAASAPGSRRFHHYGVTAHMLLSRRWNH